MALSGLASLLADCRAHYEDERISCKPVQGTARDNSEHCCSFPKSRGHWLEPPAMSIRIL